jgi:uncharacterized membrane protein YfcA
MIVGIIGNAIGIGGGILLIPFFLFYMHLHPIEASGLSLFTIIASTLGGSIRFFKEKAVDKNLYLMIALFAIPGVILGSVISKFVEVKQFTNIFGFIIICIGLFSVIATKKQSKTITEDIHNYVIKSPFSIRIFSLIAGFISGLLGIGIGGITGTFLTAIEQIPPRIAFSTIIFVMPLTSMIGSLVHFSYIKFSPKILVFLIPLTIGAITGSQIGAFISKNSKAKHLRLYQGWIITFLGFLMLIINR